VQRKVTTEWNMTGRRSRVTTERNMIARTSPRDVEIAKKQEQIPGSTTD
jgi:hypothetical protein